MDLREHVIAEVIMSMTDKIGSEQLSQLRDRMTIIFMDYDLIPHKELPSVDVIDNSYVIRHYLATKKMSGLSDKSLSTYKFHIKKFFDKVERSISDIGTNHIRRYLAELGITTSNSYVDDSRRVLNGFFSFCVNEEYILKNPVAKIGRIKQKKTMEAPYNDTEVELIREACKTERETALIDFLFSTGARRDEVRKIKLSEVNLSDRSVLIHGKGGKDRMVYFSARTELHLRGYLERRKGNSEYLFCSERAPYSQLSNAGLAEIAKKIGKRAGVSNVHLHRFRKWFATYMANRGVPLQDLKEMMGHSKLDTTNNYYIYVNNERIKASHKSNAA